MRGAPGEHSLKYAEITYRRVERQVEMWSVAGSDNASQSHEACDRGQYHVTLMFEFMAPVSHCPRSPYTIPPKVIMPKKPSGSTAQDEREEGFTHVLLITTGSVASVKAPLIVKQILKASIPDYIFSRRLLNCSIRPPYLVRSRQSRSRGHQALARLLLEGRHNTGGKQGMDRCGRVESKLMPSVISRQ